MAIFCGIVQFFRSYFFGQKVAKKCRKPFPYFFPPHCCLFLFFFISQSNFWGFFFVSSNHFDFCCVFFRREIGVGKLEPSTFFLVAQKSEHISFVCLFFWWFLALFFQCIHANMPAKILKESILSFLQFLFK